MDPRTGRVLALADKSSGLRDAAFHAGFPAASLFKVVTAAAAVERARVAPDARIAFRGGNYTLNQWNYLPNTRTDRRVMSLTEALGKSCNPVFGRVALRFLTPDALESFAERFGFNEKIYFDAPLPESAASIPSDKYGLSRTAAGFGAVTISPIHAATLMAGLANGGKMSRPILIDKITNRNGQPIYSSHTEVIAQMVRPDTARKVLEMMKSTTTIGTSRKDFAASRGRPALPVNVAAKTGTLSGKNPKGLNHWFIATAPLENPKVAIAVIVVDPQNSSARAARVGREVLEYYLFRR
jgi:cell division protein FtsI/penicillin-binding protein 2